MWGWIMSGWSKINLLFVYLHIHFETVFLRVHMKKRTHVCLYLLKFCRSTWIRLSPYSVYFKTCVSVAIIHEMIPICWTVFLASDEPSTDWDGGGVKARTRTKQSNMLPWKCSFYWKGGAWARPFISGTDTAKQQHCTATYVAVRQEHIILIRTYNQGSYVLITPKPPTRCSFMDELSRKWTTVTQKHRRLSLS